MRRLTKIAGSLMPYRRPRRRLDKCPRPDT